MSRSPIHQGIILASAIFLLASSLASPAIAGEPDRDQIVVEALLRLKDRGSELVRSRANVRNSVERYLKSHEGQREQLEAVSILKLKEHSDGLTLFLKPEVDASLQVEAVRLLVEFDELDRLKKLLKQNDDVAIVAANGLGLVDGHAARQLLQTLVTSSAAKPALKIAAASALGRGTSGQGFLLELIRSNKLPTECYFAATNALLASPDATFREAVKKHLNPESTKSGEALPPIAQLIKRRGDGKAGKSVFHGKGTCAKCHKVHGEGKEVGPDLSEIGSKLSREAMYVAILNPNAGISHNYEQYTALTVDGLVLSGLLVNKNAEAITLKTAEGVIRTIAQDDIEELKQNSTSLMPENLYQLMSVQELLDLVDYLMLLKNKEKAGFHVYGDKGTDSAIAATDVRDPSNAVQGVEVAEGLTASVFSAEPDLLSPSNIDVDHLGRVWVCEVVNYRHFRNPYNPVRKEGDRILVLEDTDGDGRADKKTVFYQGTDINSPHGVCVLGDRVIVSAGDRVVSFRDRDGDLKPEEKTLLFTGIGGVEHDHGIHAFVPGPDGKLYFNFGNEGHQLKDARGNFVVDQSGREVRDHGEPYQQGMVFRCDVDGKNVETLAWNFRNNWEVCVDSFGTMWQSDNDDDGNRATRINYVMPYGNYGYRGELDKSTWSVPRTGMHTDVSLRHWHLNDPGVVPNVVQTGAGSPTGIMTYEGDLLPKRFHGQLIHCDPGPNSVRTYMLRDDGAGYSGTISPLMTGSRDRWFRPVDVCAAPDGSLIVADWYDPGVGGHRMGDTERGRIFRVAPADHAAVYQFSKPDFATADGALEALQSPNVSTRFLAAASLRAMKDSASSRLVQLIGQAKVTTHRARALWVLASMSPGKAIRLASEDADSRIRCMTPRIAKQSGMDVVEVAARFAKDSSPQVRREAALLLHGEETDTAAKVWSELAQQHDGTDRWYLEALGIGASGNWNRCLNQWLSDVGDNWKNSSAGRDIVWRSRSESTPKLLAELLTKPQLPKRESVSRYLRAFDFQQSSPEKTAALKMIAESAQATNREAVHLLPEEWMRDPYIYLHSDGNYYLTCTRLSHTTGGVQGVEIWKSQDLKQWQHVGVPWTFDDSSWIKTVPPRAGDKKDAFWLWAPELHFLNGRWVAVHTTNRGRANLLVSANADITTAYTEPIGDKFGHRHDPFIFTNDDGSHWLVWACAKIARLKPDFSGFEGEEILLKPANRKMGHEGCVIRKIADKYVLFGTAWSTDKPRNGTYNMYYCTADKVTGPYGPRRFAGRFCGHGTPFQDKQGNWWTTAFLNGKLERDLQKGQKLIDEDKAWTYNPQGCTLVPLDVTIGSDGDVTVRASVAPYNNPGPEEAQSFELLAIERGTRQVRQNQD